MSGGQAAIEAGYDCKNSRGDINMNIARSIASENLTKPNICQYVATMIDDAGLNDNVIDKHLLFNVTQFSDLKAKNSAIDIYNKMKRRYGDSALPSITAPKTEKEKELTLNLLKRLHDHTKQSDLSAS